MAKKTVPKVALPGLPDPLESHLPRLVDLQTSLGRLHHHLALRQFLQNLAKPVLNQKALQTLLRIHKTYLKEDQSRLLLRFPRP